MSDAFISYRRDPSYAIAEAVHEKLKNRHGIDAYLDVERQDSNRVTFPERLMRAIEESPTFICFLADTTFESEWVRKEIQHAYKLKKHCIPVFQETYKSIAGDEALDYLLSFDGVHIFDKRGLMVNESVEKIAKLIIRQTPIQPNPEYMIETRVKIAPKAGVMLGGMMVILVIMALIVLAVLNGANQATTSTSDPIHTVESVALVTDELSPTASETQTTAPSDTPTASPTVTEIPSPTITLTPTNTPTEPDLFDVAAQLIQTENAGTETQIAVDMTATATQWTLTPTSTPTQTPDATQTIDAARAIIRTQTQSAIETQIVLSFTPTFTPTYTPTITLTPTPTPSPTPTLSPEQLALTPVARNTDWISYEREFDGVVMVLVPKGCFMMGSTWASDEQPVHEQCFDEPFWIDKYEVTNKQFRDFGGVAGRNSYWTGDDLPRERITWFEARDYCELRGGRLPTEREWEYAARGPSNWVYPWGNEFIADNVVYSSNSNNRTAPVGSRESGKSWVGAMDMSGNVWEWVSSLYEPYEYDAGDGHERDTGNEISVWRVLRGGSWFSVADSVRASLRFWNFPDSDHDGLGIRCFRSYP